MGELETTTIIGIGGFAIGLVFGAVAQRTNFCTMGAISSRVLMGDGRRFRAWVLAIAVAIIGTQAFSSAASSTSTSLSFSHPISVGSVKSSAARCSALA